MKHLLADIIKSRKQYSVLVTEMRCYSLFVSFETVEVLIKALTFGRMK
jgi:hypothetical protein